ncbi:hypothetical protein HLI18_19635 [Rhizobium laguerreae]|nr:hypothetical protein [Rhizobium laguerreae]
MNAYSAIFEPVGRGVGARMWIFETAEYGVAPCGGRLSGVRKHAVEDGAADGDFGLLTRQRPGPQTTPDDGLVSPDCPLKQRVFAVAVRDLPFHRAVTVDCGDMPVPLAGRSIVAWLDRVGARRNDDSRRRAMIDDCVLCRFSIIGTVGCELSDRTANLVEEWRNLRDIASILIRQGMGNDLAGPVANIFGARDHPLSIFSFMLC